MSCYFQDKAGCTPLQRKLGSASSDKEGWQATVQDDLRQVEAGSSSCQTCEGSSHLWYIHTSTLVATGFTCAFDFINITLLQLVINYDNLNQSPNIIITMHITIIVIQTIIYYNYSKLFPQSQPNHYLYLKKLLSNVCRFGFWWIIIRNAALLIPYFCM